MVMLALPPRRLAIPKTVVPSRKVTLPSGTAMIALTFLTVAVKVID
jgi:hypothetical protein